MDRNAYVLLSASYTLVYQICSSLFTVAERILIIFSYSYLLKPRITSITFFFNFLFGLCIKNNLCIKYLRF